MMDRRTFLFTAIPIFYVVEATWRPIANGPADSASNIVAIRGKLQAY